MHGIDDTKISAFRIESGLTVRILTETYETQNQQLNWMHDSEYIIVNITLTYLLCLYVELFI